LHSLAFIGCCFSPSSLNATANAIRDHINLSSISFQVDGSASAVRLLHVACNRACMRRVHVQAPYSAASQHVVSFAFPPLLSIESVVVFNVPIQTSWVECLLSSVVAISASQQLADALDPLAKRGGLRCLRLLNNCKYSYNMSRAFLNMSRAFLNMSRAFLL
jgi:hypothetical protein